MQIDTDKHYSIHDRLLPKGTCSGSCDQSKFWEITDNITETVQDRDSCMDQIEQGLTSH